MADLIIIAVVLAVVIAVTVYIVRQKKKGVKCIGCPYSGTAGCNCNNKINKGGEDNV